MLLSEATEVRQSVEAIAETRALPVPPIASSAGSIRRPCGRNHGRNWRKSVADCRILQQALQQTHFMEADSVVNKALDVSRYPFTIQLFGSFSVLVDGQPLPPLRSRKEKWLLAL